MDAEARLELALRALEVIVEANKEIKASRETDKPDTKKETVTPATEEELNEVMKALGGF